MSESDEEKLAAFHRGMGVVLADLIRSFDQPTMAANIARDNGVTLATFERAGVDPFDLAELRKALR